LNPLLTWPPHLDAVINATAATVAAEAVPAENGSRIQSCKQT
jgi:hypothetical protein